MTPRFLFIALCLVTCAEAATGRRTSVWTGAVNGDMREVYNWELPPLGVGGNLEFGSASTTDLVLHGSSLFDLFGTFTIDNIKFTNGTNYIFSGTGNPLLAIDGDFTTTGSNSVIVNSGLTVRLSNTAHAFSLAAGSDVYLGASLVGAGSWSSLIKAGGGRLHLQAANAYTGGTVITEGAVVVENGGSINHPAADLIVSGPSGSPSLLVRNGSVSSRSIGLAVDTATSGVLSVDGPGVVQALNDFSVGTAGIGELTATNGGRVSVAGGAGTLVLGANLGGSGSLHLGAGMAGGLIDASTITTGAGTGNIYLNTTATEAAPYYFTRTGLAGGGALAIAGNTHVTVQGGYNVFATAHSYTGNTTITGGTLKATGSNSALGSSLVHISNGELRLENVTASNAITMSGGSLVLAHSTLSTAPHLSAGRVSGNGFISSLKVGGGAVLAPGFDSGNQVGTFSVGHFEAAAGGTLEWNLRNANGSTPGVDWDLVEIPLSLTLEVTATPASPFTLKTISLSLAGEPGAADGLIAGQSYSWKIFDAEAISGFDPAAFRFDTSQFMTNLGGGSLSIGRIGNDVFINFAAVPEPSTYVLLGGGLIAVWASVRRKRRSAP